MTGPNGNDETPTTAPLPSGPGPGPETGPGTGPATGPGTGQATNPTVGPYADRDTGPDGPGPSPSRGPRLRTVLFGLVMAAVGILGIVAELTSVRVDAGTAVLFVLAVLGTMLLAQGVAAVIRESRGGPGA
jgi:hypothetical protein